MVWDDLTPSQILTEAAFDNAIVVDMAMGGSTNAIIHLIAMARRAGHSIGLDDFDRTSRTVPVIANIRPCGDKYLMEDFYYAGGLPALMSRLRPSSISRCRPSPAKRSARTSRARKSTTTTSSVRWISPSTPKGALGGAARQPGPATAASSSRPPLSRAC